MYLIALVPLFDNHRRSMGVAEGASRQSASAAAAETDAAGASPAAAVENAKFASTAEAGPAIPDAKAIDATGSPAPLLPPDEVDRVYRKVMLAVCPLFMATTAMSTIDRNNLSYASISLIPIIKLSPSIYGVGGGAGQGGGWGCEAKYSMWAWVHVYVSAYVCGLGVV